MINTTFNDFKTLTLLKKLEFWTVLFIFPKKRIILSECSGEIMNKYLVILVCVMCAVSTGWAKKKKSHKAVQEPEAVEQVEESAAEEPAEEPAAVEAPDETAAAVEAPAVETPAEVSEAPAEEAAAEETTVAEASETEEVAAEDESSEEVASDDEEEDQPKKKKKKKSKKKKSKKKKKKKHSDDDDSDEGAIGVKLGFHAGLGSNVLELEHGANASLNLGLGFAYFFTNNMAIVSGADLSIAATQSKVSYSNYWYSYEYTVNNAVASIVVPVKFRFAFNDMFWAEAGTGLSLSLYSYSMYSGDNKPADGGATTFVGDITNFTLGAGIKVGGGSLGLEIGYRSVLSLGLTYNSGF